MRRTASLATVLVAAVALAPVAACAASGVVLGYDEGTGIVASGQPVYPEGIAYDPVGGRFLVGSARLGHLFAIDETGELTQFSTDERIATTLGIKVDAPRNRVVAAVTDYGVGVRSRPDRRANLAAVAVFELTSGRLLDLHDLTGLVPGPAHLANDVAVDARGSIYVTDSLAAAIYRIDPAGTASVLVRSERFAGAGFTLNGLDVHPDGYLLVGKKSDGKLFKVPLDEPERFTEVTLPEPMVAADGILLVDGDLVVVRNRTAPVAADPELAPVAPNEIVVLRSDDGWCSATIAERKAHADVYPTTATRRGDRIVTVASRLNTLATVLRDDPEALQRVFQIHTIATVAGAHGADDAP